MYFYIMRRRQMITCQNIELAEPSLEQPENLASSSHVLRVNLENVEADSLGERAVNERERRRQIQFTNTRRNVLYFRMNET